MRVVIVSIIKIVDSIVIKIFVVVFQTYTLTDGIKAPYAPTADDRDVLTTHLGLEELQKL